jgi:hypothetical protein
MGGMVSQLLNLTRRWTYFAGNRESLSSSTPPCSPRLSGRCIELSPDPTNLQSQGDIAHRGSEEQRGASRFYTHTPDVGKEKLEQQDLGAVAEDPRGKQRHEEVAAVVGREVQEEQY